MRKSLGLSIFRILFSKIIKLIAHFNYSLEIHFSFIMRCIVIMMWSRTWYDGRSSERGSGAVKEYGVWSRTVNLVAHFWSCPPPSASHQRVCWVHSLSVNCQMMRKKCIFFSYSLFVFLRVRAGRCQLKRSPAHWGSRLKSSFKSRHLCPNQKIKLSCSTHTKKKKKQVNQTVYIICCI